MSDSLPVYTDTQTHTHTHTFLPWFPFIRVLSFSWLILFLFFCLNKQTHPITSIFPHGLRPLQQVARQAEPKVGQVAYFLHLVALLLLAQTRNAAGVLYKFQAFSMQLH